MVGENFKYNNFGLCLQKSFTLVYKHICLLFHLEINVWAAIIAQNRIQSDLDFNFSLFITEFPINIESETNGHFARLSVQWVYIYAFELDNNSSHHVILNDVLQ